MNDEKAQKSPLHFSPHDNLRSMLQSLYDDGKLYQAVQMVDGARTSDDDIINECLVSAIKCEWDEVVRLLEEVSNLEGWRIVKDDNECKVCYRHEETTPIHSLYVEGTIQCPVFNILACINEVDLIPSWVPFVKHSEQLSQIARIRQLAHCSLWIPWPFADRDAILYGYAVNLLEESGKIVVSMTSCNKLEDVHFMSDAEMISIPEPAKNTQRVDVHLAGIVLEVVDRETTRVQIMANADPKLAFVPNWLVNFVSRHMAHLFFRVLKRKATNLQGTEHETRISEKQEIYGFLSETMEMYFNGVHNDQKINKEDMSERKLPPRSTRGRRMKELIGEEAEADVAFWGHGVWGSEDDDDEFDGVEAVAKEEEDVLSSDFDMHESEEEPEEEDDEKSTRRKRKTFNLPKPSLPVKKQKTEKQITQITPKVSVGLRASTRLKSSESMEKATFSDKLAAERRATTTRPQLRVPTQEERMESARIIAEENTRSLEEMALLLAQREEEETAKRARLRRTQKELRGARIVFRSSATDGNTLTFTGGAEEEIFPEPKEIRQEQQCVITGRRAKYIDPLTGFPFASSQAFHVIRERVAPGKQH